VSNLLAAGKLLAGRGLLASRHKSRERLPMEEHEDIPLPTDIIRSDGTFDLYDDVQTRFQIEYKAKAKQLVIRGSRWIGHVPINDRYVLSIDTRVPVSNIEQVLARSPFKAAETIPYSHAYESTLLRAQSLFDVLTDQFLHALDVVRRDGLLKVYLEEKRISASPTGRIDPLKTRLLTLARGRPTASYSAYYRTEDTQSNRVIGFALICLRSHYNDSPQSAGTGQRLARITNTLAHFEHISHPTVQDLKIDTFVHIISNLPSHRESYADALRLAYLITNGESIAVRGEGGLAILPAVLINMSEIFESYVRSVLDLNLAKVGFSVLDGNKFGDLGAGVSLFDPFYMGGDGPEATPDIVVKDSAGIQLIIDVKYKPIKKKLPERPDLNQIVCYGQRYGAKKVMALHPASRPDDPPVTTLGKVGDTMVYLGLFNLSAPNLADEEVEFAKKIGELLSER
jgi:5-methylcytosine-specific restriction enzyme subunit McrC